MKPLYLLADCNGAGRTPTAFALLPGLLACHKAKHSKLRMLHNSQNLADLRIPPANRLEKLVGNLKDFYSIRINDQWRIIFRWSEGRASGVEIVDYH